MEFYQLVVFVLFILKYRVDAMSFVHLRVTHVRSPRWWYNSTCAFYRRANPVTYNSFWCIFPFSPPSPRGAVSTNPYPSTSQRNLSIMRTVGTPVGCYPILLHSCPDSTDPVVRSNRAKKLLHFGFVIIAVCAARFARLWSASFLLTFFGFRYARSIWLPTDPTNLEAPKHMR